MMAALVLVALLVAGCSKRSTDTEADRRSASSRTTSTTTVEQLAVRFADCIRQHDVPDFPDADANGDFRFGINVSPQVWQAAVAACKDLEPPGALSGDRSPEQQSASLRFAECVRENGVPDFPDPVNGEPLIDTTKIPSTDREGGMATLDAALATCRDLLDEAARQR